MKKIATMYEDTNNNEQKDRIRDVMHSYLWYLLGAKTPESATRKCSLPEEMLDTEGGLRWLEKAGDLGHMDAASQLGNLYMTGQHPEVGTKLAKGMGWFKKAAEMGNGQCAFQLAMAYRCGIVPVNPSLQKRWLKVADRLGYAEARAALDNVDSSIGSEEAEKRFRQFNKEKNIEQYLTTDHTDQCSNPTCDRREAQGEKFDTCALCRSAKYCSRKCQKAHSHAGHKSEYKML